MFLQKRKNDKNLDFIYTLLFEQSKQQLPLADRGRFKFKKL